MSLSGVIPMANLRAVEGQQVDVMLADGTRLDNCNLVSVGRLWARTVWLSRGETDLFVTPEEITCIRAFESGRAA